VARWAGEKSEWEGFERWDFLVAGKMVTVVRPKRAAKGKPWIWRAQFWAHEPGVDIALLGRGFHLVFLDSGNTFGCPAAMVEWEELYGMLVKKHGFSRRPALEGLSRGGLFVYGWAARHPEAVSCIYADNAVCDFKSWPGPKGKAGGSAADWKELQRVYGFKTEAAALAYRENPIDALRRLARAKIPVMHVCGDADETVPYEENSAVLKVRYQKMGGSYCEIMKPGMKHHPHGLVDPAPIVEFILRETINGER